MAKVSVIIPSRNERFLPQTIDDALAKAAGDIEVIAALDDYWPNPPLREHPNLVVIHRAGAQGMRSAINSAAAIAKGEYLAKCDAHCMFAPGFDEVLKAGCDENWIVIPRRYRLDAEAWAWQEVGKPPVDYHYLSCPITNKDGYSMHGAIWPERARERSAPEYDIDDTMSFQGSFWFMHRRHFFDFLGGMSEVGYGGFSQEPQEIGNKTWLGGGRLVVNKKTWYAHLHKGTRYGRGYFMSKAEVVSGHGYSARYWMENQWPDRVHDIEWLIDKFWPVPTWPEDWQLRRHESVHQAIVG
jgi:glycosyltransferase involved in cell wall biosynthesis